ncbi:MAG: histidine ammonia-lyase [Candidatus Methanofastidiosia archaeon]
MNRIIIDGESLKIQEVFEVALNRFRVSLSKDAKDRVLKNRFELEEILEGGEIIYGVNTGFGEFLKIKISKEETMKLQENLIRSHSFGVSKPLAKEFVRAAMLLRANALAKGFSGVRLEIIKTLLEMLNRGVHPIVPSKGSVGASGDLQPLSHIALVMMGEGKAEYKGEVLAGIEALKRAGISSLTFSFKEGLALINGTQIMTGIGALLVSRSENLLKNAQIASAMSFEALRGNEEAFDERIQALRKHPGQAKVAKNMKRLLEGRVCDTENLQDAYTLRCIPQVLGAIFDTLEYVEKIIETEMNSATDNPLIFKGDVLSGGNFHGEPVALALDFLGIALSEIGNFSERRISRLLDPTLSGLKASLIEKAGLNSGLMITQYTAAALASENKILSHPASVDSIPTSANQEDHVSMGTTAALKAFEILKNVERIVSIEYLCAAQALDFLRRTEFGKGVKIAYKVIRKRVRRVEDDRVLVGDLEHIKKLLRDGKLSSEVERVLGKFG